MIILKGFINRIENSTSRAFIGYDENNKKWVIRPKLKKYTSKRLFNEYFSGKLGEELGISRPPVDLIKLNINISKYFEEEIDYDSFAVATKYYDNITSVKYPPNSNCNDEDFPEENVKHLYNLFGRDYNFEEFYAYRIFSAWIYLEDYAKYENLHIDKKSLKPIFIDFDFSFKGIDWDDLPTDYVYYKIESCAFFLDGVITDIKRFEKYFTIISNIDNNKFQQIINSLPENWAVPQRFKNNLMNLLFEQREIFIREFLYVYDDEM